MYLDYHMHTARCRHAEGTLKEYADAARRSGISEIGFSDHCPYLREFEHSVPTSMIAMPLTELDDYVADVIGIRRSARIPVKLGLEIDYLPGDFRVFSFLSKYKFDYFIGSIHYIGGWGVDQEEFQKGFLSGDRLWKQYQSMVGDMARTGLFDIVGHFDLPKKFGAKPGRTVRPYFRNTLEAVKKSGMAMEINTSGLDRPVREFYPSLDILGMCAEMGIPLTLGSDSHKPCEVGRHFDKARKMLRRLGYRSLVSFTGHLQSEFEL